MQFKKKICTKKGSYEFLGVFSALFGIAALMMGFIESYKVTAESLLIGQTSYGYTMYDLMFGCNATIDANGNQIASAGLIIAFVFSVVGTILSLCSLLFQFKGEKEGKTIRDVTCLFSAVLFITAGILFFSALPLTGLLTGTEDYSFATMTATAEPGIYLTGIMSVMAGISQIPILLEPWLLAK